MKLLSFYNIFTGSQNDFTRQFQNNEQLFNQAKSFWNALNGITEWLVIICVIIGMAMAIYYYTIHNNKPRRHYTPLHWAYFFIPTIILTFGLSLGVEWWLCNPILKESRRLEIKIALGNSLYACIVYLITSVIWCNCGRTNAYRMFKFKRHG